MNTQLLAAPEGAVVLFDGSNIHAWTKRDGSPAEWPILADGSVLTKGKDIVSTARFGDFQLHVEFWCNASPDEVKGQGRSNSGVFLQGRYEIQVLDSFGIDHVPGTGDCGALYNNVAPLVNACRPPEEWQTYDIFFRAPRFAASGEKTESARVTALQNGVLIHNNVAIDAATGAPVDVEYATPGPILLQDHGNDVRYRNVWVLPVPESGADFY